MTPREPAPQVVADQGSFKDPDAQVLRYGDRVFRRFNPEGGVRFRTFIETGLPKVLVSREKIVGWEEVSQTDMPELYAG